MLRYHSASRGKWLLAAADGRVLVVAAKDDPSALETTWAAIASAAGVQSVLDVLASNGLSATPPFALLDWSGEFATGTAKAHLIVRGRVTASAVANGETVELDGESATTWVERTLEGVASIDLRFGTDATAAVTLPLERGMAWVDRVVLAAQGVTPVAPTAAAPVVPAAAPVTAPVAAPVAPPPAVAAPPGPQLVSPPSAPIIVPQAAVTNDEIEDATIAEYTTTVVADDESPVAADEPAAVEENSFGYDSLFEETMVRSIEDAAVRPEEEVEEEAAPAATGDHDGMTMMASDFAALRAARKKTGKPAVAAVAATPTFRLHLSDGGIEPLTQTVLVGRAPSVSKISGGQIPRLVTLTGSDDISRNHAQFSIEGDTVVVTDLHSRNGTTIVIPGRSPQTLRAGEPTSVLVDTIVDLGGGVTITIKEA
jgi:hypothetical protein